ncbi:hypothetical protein P7C70_g8156, partial [Phenoliferia sp. Uapishka_3]
HTHLLGSKLEPREVGLLSGQGGSPVPSKKGKECYDRSKRKVSLICSQTSHRENGGLLTHAKKRGPETRRVGKLGGVGTLARAPGRRRVHEGAGKHAPLSPPDIPSHSAHTQTLPAHKTHLNKPFPPPSSPPQLPSPSTSLVDSQLPTLNHTSFLPLPAPRKREQAESTPSQATSLAVSLTQTHERNTLALALQLAPPLFPKNPANLPTFSLLIVCHTSQITFPSTSPETTPETLISTTLLVALRPSTPSSSLAPRTPHILPLPHLNQPTSSMSTTNTTEYSASWRSDHIEEQLSDARPVIFNSIPLYALIPSDESGVHMKLPIISGVSGGIVAPDSPLTTPNKQFIAAASAGDGRSMVTQYARVRKLALDDPLRWFFKFEVDREVDEGLDITLPGNATPTRVRLFLYAQSNARDPELRAGLAKLYKNPNFHFQFSLALYYEAMEAQARLLVAGAQRIREVTTDTAATRARGELFFTLSDSLQRSGIANWYWSHSPVSGFLDAPRAQAVSMGVVAASVGLMGEQLPARQRQKRKESNKLHPSSATSDPRLLPIDPRAQSVAANTSTRLETSIDSLASVPMTRGAEISLPKLSQQGGLPLVSPAGVTAASLASANTKTPSSTSNTSPTTSSPPSPANKEQRQVTFVAPQTPPTTPGTPRTPHMHSTPLQSPRSAPGSRLPPQNRFSPLERHIANSHKRQHSSPSSSSSGSGGRHRVNYIRQNPTYQQNYDWRAQKESRASTSTGTGNSPSTSSPVATYGVGSSPGSPQATTNYYSSAPYPNIPPPFSWDHIVHTRSRAIVHSPSFQNNNANTGTASSSLQASVQPPPYVPSSKTQRSYANIVFGRSGASIPAPSSSLLPSAPLRTGGNQIDFAKLPRYAKFPFDLANLSKLNNLDPRAPAFTPDSARQPPVASSSSSSPSYVATFATIPRTVEANTLQDLQHGVDDCNTYPTLSDISEMPEEGLADDEGEFTEVVSKRARRSARLTAKVSSSSSSPSSIQPSARSLTSRPSPQPTTQQDHSYAGKGKQRAFNQGSGKSRSDSGKLPKLTKDLELELSAPRPQKKREFRRDEPYGVIRNMRAHISKLEGMIWESAKKEDGSLRTRADRWRVIEGH